MKSIYNIVIVLIIILSVSCEKDPLPPFSGMQLNENGCFEIYTAEQLDKIALTRYGLLSANFILINDISLSGSENWTAIGTDNDPFTGTFDGNGYSISNLTIDSDSSYQGLFGYVDGGIITNLTLKDMQVEGGSYVGAICGYISSGEISNCEVDNGTVSGSSYVGGVVGDASSSLVTSCYNTGSVEGSSYVGGVVGYTSSISLCCNKGNVSGTGNYVGGVAGVLSSSVSSIIITSCYNMGTISGDSNVGGVIGCAFTSFSTSFSAFSINIKSCYNTGAISGSGNNIGGVIGITNSDSASTYFSTTFVSCYNTGKVSEGENNIGGVVGYAYARSSSNITTSSCYYLPYNDTTYTSSYGTADSDLVTTMTASAFPATLNTAAGEDYFEYDTNNYNDGYPIISSIDYSAINN